MEYNKVIYKYAVGFSTNLFLPKNAVFLDAQFQHGSVVIWFLVDKNAKEETRSFVLIGTGHPVRDSLKYLRTIQVDTFVWHLFEETP